MEYTFDEEVKNKVFPIFKKMDKALLYKLGIELTYTDLLTLDKHICNLSVFVKALTFENEILESKVKQLESIVEDLQGETL